MRIIALPAPKWIMCNQVFRLSRHKAGHHGYWDSSEISSDSPRNLTIPRRSEKHTLYSFVSSTYRTGCRLVNKKKRPAGRIRNRLLDSHPAPSADVNQGRGGKLFQGFR